MNPISITMWLLVSLLLLTLIILIKDAIKSARNKPSNASVDHRGALNWRGNDRPVHKDRYDVGS